MFVTTCTNNRFFYPGNICLTRIKIFVLCFLVFLLFICDKLNTKYEIEKSLPKQINLRIVFLILFCLKKLFNSLCIPLGGVMSLNITIYYNLKNPFKIKVIFCTKLNFESHSVIILSSTTMTITIRQHFNRQN